MIATTALSAIAATLPPGVRARYREEWLADAEGARSLGVVPGSLIVGALGVAATIDRDDPVVAGVDPRRLMYRRLRVVAATSATALLLLFGGFVSGIGGASGIVLLIVTALTLLVTLATLLGAMRAGARARGGRMSAPSVALAGAVGVGVLAAFAVVPILAAPLLGGAILVFLILVIAGDPRPQAAAASRTTAVLLMLLSAAAILGTLAVALVHVFVWNPLAKLPGMGLDEIYARLAAANELPSPVLPVAVCVVWGIIAIGGIVVAAHPAPKVRRLMTVRRILGFSIVSVGLIGAGVFMLGFSMGMGIADTFATSGGDAAGTGIALGVIGVAALIASAFVGLLPSRIRTA